MLLTDLRDYSRVRRHVVLRWLLLQQQCRFIIVMKIFAIAREDLSLEYKYRCRPMVFSKQPSHTFSTPSLIIPPFRQRIRCCRYYFCPTMSTSTPNTRAWSSGHLAQSGHRGGTGEFDPDHLDPSASISSVLPGSPNDPIDERGINEDVDDLEEGDDRDLADGAPAPRRAWPWTFKQLLKRVETAKGEASRPVVNFVKE